MHNYYWTLKKGAKCHRAFIRKLRRRLKLAPRKYWHLPCNGGPFIDYYNLRGNLMLILQDKGILTPYGISDEKILKALHKLMNSKRAKRKKK